MDRLERRATMAMKGFEGEGKMTSFMLDTEARQAILLMVGSKGMGAYLRDVIRADLTARGLLGKKARTAAVKKAPEPVQEPEQDLEPPPVEPTPATEGKPPQVKRLAPKKSDPAYHSWSGMRSNSRRAGIAIDPTWDDFATFKADMGEQPPGMILVRRDTSAPWSRANCKWGTKRDVKTSDAPRYAIDGETMNLSQVAAHYGINRGTLQHRIKRQGMTIEEAVAEPVRA